MLFKFVKTKPPFEALWKAIKLLKLKPIAGHPVEQIQIAMLIYTSTHDFMPARQYLSEDIDESGLRVMDIGSIHLPSEYVKKFSAHFPNPNELEFSLLYVLLQKPQAIYQKVIGVDGMSNSFSAQFMSNVNDYSTTSVKNKVHNRYTLLNDLQKYFPDKQDEVIFETKDLEDLNDTILHLHLSGKTALPTFILDDSGPSQIQDGIAMDDIPSEEISLPTERMIYIGKEISATGRIDYITTPLPEGWIPLSDKLYQEVYSMECNDVPKKGGNDKTYKCLRYIKSENSLDIADIHQITFDHSTSATIIRYEEV